MQNLTCKRLQCDEIWSYVLVKQAHIGKGTPKGRIGDQWTFVALDPDTKLVPSIWSASALVTTPWSSCPTFRIGSAIASKFQQTRCAPMWTL
jgi:hypothetical protein